MGPIRRGRKSLHPPPVRTPLKELDLNSNSVPLPDTASAVPTDSQSNAVMARDLASVPGTPTQESAVVNLPTRPGTPTGINTPSWSATATESHTPRERSPERAQGKDNGAPSNGPVDSPGNPFSTSSPATLTAGTLHKAIENTCQIAIVLIAGGPEALLLIALWMICAARVMAYGSATLPKS
ncbi:hypothetical protein FRC12_000136 [Ceratobasidium sp. 428]|nr:hypothetical protein FRC12_000136 [Ceratobasidium sp. 428]